MWGWLNRQLLNTIFPPRCGGCKKLGDWLCQDCWQGLALTRTPLCYRCGRISPGFRICPGCQKAGGLSRLAFCGYWQDPLRRLLLNLKYRRLRILADYLIELMTNSWDMAAAPVDLVVPVPLHWRRSWQRGFNQAELLATGVAKKLGVDAVDLLVRYRPTQPQFSLAKISRQANVLGVFAVKRRWQGLVNGKTILVVDDVVATGSTIEECAKILKQKGAKQVWGLVVARA